MSSKNLQNLRIRVLLAGTFRGADSAEANRDLIRYIKQKSPERDVELIEDRRPLDLISHIRNARVVIGTSQHLHITAHAYNIPRVVLSTLFYNKPIRYARYWDPDMPSDVSLDQLDTAVGVALANAQRPDVNENSERLSRLAHENMEALAKEVIALATTERTEDKERRRQMRQKYSQTPTGG